VTKTAFSGEKNGFAFMAFIFFFVSGDEVIFLDPHTTQQACSVVGKDNETERLADLTYHCQYASRLHILQVDPSLAVVSWLHCEFQKWNTLPLVFCGG